MTNDRVFVKLNRDDDGYPPWEEEEIWATRLGENRFVLDACPTFALGLSYRDVVETVLVGDRCYVRLVVESGGHSTLRVLLLDMGAHDDLIRIAAEFELDVDPY